MITMTSSLLILATLAMLCVTSFGESEKEQLDWWQRTIVYQIYPRSFQDSDGDGVGDINGIRQHLDHFKYLGVETVWLSPVYESPMRDYGYDVANFTNIDPMFGTLEDFDNLVIEMHELDIRLLMDFIPNHSSCDHDWFIQSSKSRDNPYSDYYCWNDGKLNEQGERIPPNNWLTVFGGSAWTWSEVRQQYYLHQFLSTQPDLNYRNPNVRQAMKDVLTFWLDRGVDGFRVDAIQVLMEDERLLDELPSGDDTYSPEEYFYLRHDYTVEQPGLHDVIRDWRDLFDERQKTLGTDYVLMISEFFTPSLDEESAFATLNTTAHKLAHYSSGASFPFNFYLLQPNASCGGDCFRKHIDAWMENLEPGMWPNHVLGNHDIKRITTRKGALYASALNVLLLTLPGTPTTYYGEELGQLDIDVTYEDTQDPWGKNAGPSLYQKYSRDPCRSPMQWSTEPNSGFTSGQPWLPTHPNYLIDNVQCQRDDETGYSTLQTYRAAAQLRRQPPFRGGHAVQYQVVDQNILSYLREKPGHPTYLVALHLGVEPRVHAPFQETFSGTVVLQTRAMSATDSRSTSAVRELSQGSKVIPSAIIFEPGDAIVVKLDDVIDDRQEL